MTLFLVDGKKGDPDTAEQQLDEGQKLGFTECVREIPEQQSQNGAPKCKSGMVTKTR